MGHDRMVGEKALFNGRWGVGLALKIRTFIFASLQACHRAIIRMWRKGWQAVVNNSTINFYSLFSKQKYCLYKSHLLVLILKREVLFCIAVMCSPLVFLAHFVTFHLG